MASGNVFIFQTTRKHQSTEKSDKSKFQYTQSTCEYCWKDWWFGSAQHFLVIKKKEIQNWQHCSLILSLCTHYSQTSTAKYASMYCTPYTHDHVSWPLHNKAETIFHLFITFLICIYLDTISSLRELLLSLRLTVTSVVVTSLHV